MSAFQHTCPETAQALRDAFSNKGRSEFYARGFMLDDQNYVHLVVSCTKDSSDTPYLAQTTNTLHTLTLNEIQRIARFFYDETGPEDKIFSSAPDALSRKKTLGYVCYQMTRRLQRLEQTHFGNRNTETDYTKPFDEKLMATIINDTIKKITDENGYLMRPQFAEIRASNIPVAFEHEQKQVSKLCAYPPELSLDLKVA